LAERHPVSPSVSATGSRTVRGAVVGVKGKAKAVAGIVTDDESLREEGRAQQK
jgi:uncharacterized protein YjbJ (UPF0337 family)